jgi:aspartyl-tRNA(Asn)/glutamyl-tRNA(Gln) amidotransferase subunit A
MTSLPYANLEPIRLHYNASLGQTPFWHGNAFDMTTPTPTIDQMSRQLAQGERTASQLLAVSLAQIDHLDGELHAWVSVHRQAAGEQAAQLDAELAAGKCRGPLHGVPIAIKDIVDVAGCDTRAGSRVLCCRAKRDATVVARLRAAGAVFVGKTVTTEFACFDPPPTRNPWNTAHTPGGSSSGSAVAVATGMCAAALGSQTGGSITRPASYCGIAGLKPTIGRVSVRGVVPVSFTLDHVGPLARSIADLAVLYNCLAGFDVGDPHSVDMPQDRFIPLRHGNDTDRAPRLGLIDGFFHGEASDAVRRATRSAMDRLCDAGAEVDAVSLPESFTDVLTMHRCIMATEAAEYHRHWFPARREEYGPNLASLLDEGLGIAATDYAEALRHRKTFQREMARLLWPYDALVTPATTTTAPTCDTTGDPRFNAPWSYSGLPTVSLPCGLAQDGLPVAIQFVGAAYSESRLLATAGWCERRLPTMPPPPQLRSDL